VGMMIYHTLLILLGEIRSNGDNFERFWLLENTENH